MNYDPPSETNWYYTGWFCESYADAYNEGFLASALGGNLDDNPYEPSGHERDTTYDDELHYWWYSGFCAYEKDDED